MPQALIDDALWTRIEPRLPKRRPRNRQYAERMPIPDRAVLTGMLFVLRSGVRGWSFSGHYEGDSAASIIARGAYSSGLRPLRAR